MDRNQTNHVFATNLSYGPDTAARLIGIGRTKFFELLRSGEIQSVTIGGRRLIRHTDLEEFLNRLLQRSLPQSAGTRADSTPKVINNA